MSQRHYSVLCRYPTLCSMMLLSSETDATLAPSPRTATAHTWSRCSFTTWLHLLATRSHTRTCNGDEGCRHIMPAHLRIASAADKGRAGWVGRHAQHPGLMP